MSGNTTKTCRTTQSQLQPGATVAASPSRDSQAASKADIDSLKSELLSSLRSEIIEVFKAELRALERTLGNDLLTIKSELQGMKAQLSSDKAANEAAVRELKGTVVEMERSLSVCTDDIAVIQHDIHRLTAEYNKLETKCKDLEARSRRDNVRIIGVPEGPNSSTTASVAVLLKEALNSDGGVISFVQQATDISLEDFEKEMEKEPNMPLRKMHRGTGKPCLSQTAKDGTVWVEEDIGMPSAVANHSSFTAQAGPTESA
ncbi:hypothetical protein HF521_010246 [Silurus meridionalis]|uniref:Uncharacterized protein n=1 Tax=Silurus meridionalis TaxID=175797 RepID=A0A8T0ALM2_SILME|nr:hypothetical protein HF521_010246 [Silurus meridionalis]